MDLADFDLAADAERGTVVHLRNPRTGDPLTAEDGSPVQVFVQGADSAAYRKAQRTVQGEVALRNAHDGPLGVEEIDAHTASILAAVTTGWRNVVVQGEAWEFNPEAAKALYGRFEWIRAQVDAAVTDRARFGSQDRAA